MSLVIYTFYPLTLNQYLGTLTIVWVVPLSVYKFTPVHPSLEIYDIKLFWVGQETDPFRSQNLQSVAIPVWLSHSRLDCGLLRQEPAITRLDWLFTPIPKSEERLHTEPLQASTKFYLCFTLFRDRSSSFGSNSSDLSIFILFSSWTARNWFPCGYFLIILATWTNSQARYSKRTLQLLRAVTFHNH